MTHHLTPVQIGALIFIGIMFIGVTIYCYRGIKRSNKVYKFKTYVLFNYPLSVTMALPPYRELLKYKGELKLENFVPNYETMTDDDLKPEDFANYINEENKRI